MAAHPHSSQPRFEARDGLSFPRRGFAGELALPRQLCLGAVVFEGLKLDFARRFAPRNIWYTVPIPEEDGTFAPSFPSVWVT
jgi:hypothetical protein